MHDGAGDPADDPGAFDRKVAEVLDAEAGMLSDKSERLLATGSVSIDRPAGMLNASLRPPRWWRPGVFRQWAVREDGATSSGVVPLGRAMDATSVLSEITLQLAVSVAWLDESARGGEGSSSGRRARTTVSCRGRLAARGAPRREE